MTPLEVLTKEKEADPRVELETVLGVKNNWAVLSVVEFVSVNCELVF
jgi:hypothetical protein